MIDSAKRSLHKMLAPAVACLVSLTSLAMAQTAATPQNNSAEKPFVYDVVSIKPSHSVLAPGIAANTVVSTSTWRMADNSITISNATLGSLVETAFGVFEENQLSGLPGWATSDPYDVNAKMDDETAAALKKLSRKDRMKQTQLMLQALLADRCQFKFHRETRLLPAYDLVIAKGGLKIKESLPKEGPGRSTAGPGTIAMEGITIEVLAASLSRTVGRFVVDKTGLGNKRFDISLTWTTDEQQGTADAGPSIYAALEEQLGLKLVPSKAPVETIVVDQMEKPSAN
jgi:uncharacterized protein (TIGR03435 family)